MPKEKMKIRIGVFRIEKQYAGSAEEAEYDMRPGTDISLRLMYSEESVKDAMEKAETYTSEDDVYVLLPILEGLASSVATKNKDSKR